MILRSAAAAVSGREHEIFSLCRLISDGFYGVDLKQAGERVVVIEVNDNPNVDAGIEDAVLGRALYERIMAVFLARMEARVRQGC